MIMMSAAPGATGTHRLRVGGRLALGLACARHGHGASPAPSSLPGTPARGAWPRWPAGKCLPWAPGWAAAPAPGQGRPSVAHRGDVEWPVRNPQLRDEHPGRPLLLWNLKRKASEALSDDSAQ